VSVRVRPVPVEPNPSASLSFVNKSPGDWAFAFARALDTAENQVTGWYHYVYEFTTVDGKPPAASHQKAMEENIYQSLLGLLGPPAGQIPSFFLWSLISGYRSYNLRQGMNPIILDMLSTNGWLAPPPPGPDMALLAQSVLRAVANRSIEHFSSDVPDRVTKFFAGKGRTPEFDLTKPGQWLAEPHPHSPPVYKGYYQVLAEARPSRGKMTGPQFWAKTVAEQFNGASSLIHQVMNNTSQLPDIEGLLQDDERDGRDNFFNDGLRMQLLDYVYGPPNLEVPSEVLGYLEERAYGAWRLKTYLVYRHHVWLPKGEPVDEPGVGNFPLLMGAAPMLA